MNLPDFLTQDEYGEIRLTGHRIPLLTVIDLYNEGYTARMIVDHLPTLSPDSVDDVIAFYLKNQADVDAYVEACHEEMERQEAAPRKGPDFAELKRRMEAKRRTEAG